LQIRRESIEELVIPELARRLPQYVDALCTAARRQSIQTLGKIILEHLARHGLGLSEGYCSFPELSLTKGARLMIQPSPEVLLNTGKVFSLLVAGVRNHLQANRSLGFCFEIPV
jgi:hypothetical protein